MSFFSNKTELEKDIANPVRRFIRHTLMADKYGSMMQYHIDACNYYYDKPKVDLQKVMEEESKKTDEYVKKYEEREAKKQNKDLQKDISKELDDISAEDLEVIKDLIKEIKKEKASTEAVSENKDDLSIKKGEDGLYRYSPITIH